ncbi:MAG: ATP-binding cassette domain-containing protein [Cyclobacteriaceae bacterium]|nr:ATP-binding cassette domain-containing protein [Cyclobacteriaceae bacterium]MCH8517113.1 ATP-binding cassette domain-containing protein [Cyclobacteriaceae bacterium]
MSEEILKALTQLFAIITKQDGGVTEKERAFVIGYFRQELDQDSVNEYVVLYDNFVGYNKEKTEDTNNEEEEKKKKRKLTSVRDSVKTLAICKKINKTLTQKQKVVVLIKLLELVGSDKNFTPQRMEIIDTVSTVFNIVKDEYKLIESFVLEQNSRDLNHRQLLALNDSQIIDDNKETKHLYADINGEILFLNVNIVDMYFVKYVGQDEIILNGFIMKSGQVYLFAHGSTIKTQKGTALYYSDLVQNFIEGHRSAKLSFIVKDVEFRFPNGDIGLRNINISEGPGKLIGIMGASGAGKTTLLNVLAGIETPSSGSIRINGYDLNNESDELDGVIGYVSQDDLLIEELTVFENLYYNAKLCFAQMSENELKDKVLEILSSLGLEQRKDLRVGSVLDKTISGGQRKRLNIALELIREPAILFVDEPTSGLSSRDSENVIDLLKELSLKGKLIFVVIHQPSSDIYKMFDKMYLMDTGGYPVFYGHPIEAVTYFKRSTNQVDSERGQCQTCGNVNPEQIFNIIEANVVDEYGQFTNKRKITPQQWFGKYKESFSLTEVKEETEKPDSTLNIPNRIKQAIIFTTRDSLSKISNRQYLLINLLEAPFLATLLAFIIRYKATIGDGYVYRFNENIPAYILIAIIVALFMGLTVSAEEIIRDRKILKRERFLNLSWSSYLLSKIIILFSLSAIQTFTFVLIGNSILGIQGMHLAYWFALFSVSCFANVLGLNVSGAFNSAVTVYILIPLLLIPQMILSGLLFPFDKLNNILGSQDKVPLVADLMVSRWSYEALAVHQFKNNRFQEIYYPFEQIERMSDFKSAFLIPKLQEKIDYVKDNWKSENDSILSQVSNDWRIINIELQKVDYREEDGELSPDNRWTIDQINEETISYINSYLRRMDDYYEEQFQEALVEKDKRTYFYENNEAYQFNQREYKDRYFNENLSELVRNISTKNRIIEVEGELIQQIDPIYNNDKDAKHIFDYRTQFFRPEKQFLGKYWDTYGFNLSVIWIMTLLLYAALYFELLPKLIRVFSK